MNKRLKSIGAIIASTLIVATNFVGCGSDGGNKSASTTLTYTIWDKNQEPGMQSIIDAFEEKNSDIKVKLEITPWDQYWTKLEAAATGGAMPDVFWMHANEIRKYAGGDMLMNLTDMIDDSKIVDMSKFPKDLVDIYSLDGKNYAMPKDIDTIGLWYNKTLFDEAGVSYPDENWTWDDLLDASNKLTNSEKGIYGYAANMNSQEGYYNYIFQNGGSVIREVNGKKVSGYDMPETQEAIQWYVDLSLDKKVSPTNTQFSDTPPVTMLQSGKVAMILAGSWVAKEFSGYEYIAKNCDVAVLPQGKQKATIYNGLANAVSAKTKNPEAALKFIEFLGGEEAAIIHGKSGAAMPAYEGTQQEWANAFDMFSLDKCIEMLKYGYIFPNSKNKTKWADEENKTLLKVFQGTLDVKTACNEISEKMNAVLAEE